MRFAICTIFLAGVILGQDEKDYKLQFRPNEGTVLESKYKYEMSVKGTLTFGKLRINIDSSASGEGSYNAIAVVNRNDLTEVRIEKSKIKATINPSVELILANLEDAELTLRGKSKKPISLGEQEYPETFVNIDRRGRVTFGDDNAASTDFSKFYLPEFPEKHLRVGATWFATLEGLQNALKEFPLPVPAKMKYNLDKVEVVDGKSIATISGAPTIPPGADPLTSVNMYRIRLVTKHNLTDNVPVSSSLNVEINFPTSMDFKAEKMEAIHVKYNYDATFGKK